MLPFIASALLMQITAGKVNLTFVLPQFTRLQATFLTVHFCLFIALYQYIWSKV